MPITSASSPDARPPRDVDHARRLPSAVSDLELAERFLPLHQALLRDRDPEAVLARLVGSVVAQVPGCEWAGVTSWPGKGRPISLAASHQVARDLDGLQHAVREGPCLVVPGGVDLVRVDDLGTDDRWPRFAAAAVRSTSLRSLLVFHLPGAHHSTLALGAGRAGAFEGTAVDAATRLWLHARVLMGHAATTAQAENLARALSSSRLIGVAVGVLMHTRSLTADEAFELMRTTSMRMDRKVRDIAEAVVETGQLPNRSGPEG